MLSAKEAAEQTGLTKAAILKAIRTGRLSATKDINGEYQIDPVELYRVYSPAPTQTPQLPETPSTGIVERLEREIELLREIIQSKDDVIEDLRQRLDAESAERRVYTKLLTDSEALPWWRRVFK